jgi:hypothetical protein
LIGRKLATAPIRNCMLNAAPKPLLRYVRVLKARLAYERARLYLAMWNHLILIILT